jgi:hypothetical protein
MTNESPDPPVEPVSDPLLDSLLDLPAGAVVTPAPRRAFFALSPNTAAPSETTHPPSPLPSLDMAHTEPDTETDLPLLTDIVTVPFIAPVSAHAAAPTAATDTDALHRELSHWLAEELPAAVLQVTDGIADQLVKELTDRAKQQLLPRLLARLGKAD